MMLLILLSTVSFIMEGEVVGGLPRDPCSTSSTSSTRCRSSSSRRGAATHPALLPAGLLLQPDEPRRPRRLPARPRRSSRRPTPGRRGFDGIAFLRVMRLVRVFHVFKFGKYSGGIRFAGALRMSYKPLGVLVLILLIATVSASLLHDRAPAPQRRVLGYYLAANGFDDAKHDECWDDPRLLVGDRHGDSGYGDFGRSRRGQGRRRRRLAASFSSRCRSRDRLELRQDGRAPLMRWTTTRGERARRHIPAARTSASLRPPLRPARSTPTTRGRSRSSSCASSSTTRRTRTRCGRTSTSRSPA